MVRQSPMQKWEEQQRLRLMSKRIAGAKSVLKSEKLIAPVSGGSKGTRGNAMHPMQAYYHDEHAPSPGQPDEPHSRGAPRRKALPEWNDGNKVDYSDRELRENQRRRDAQDQDRPWRVGKEATRPPAGAQSAVRGEIMHELGRVEKALRAGQSGGKGKEGGARKLAAEIEGLKDFLAVSSRKHSPSSGDRSNSSATSGTSPGGEDDGRSPLSPERSACGVIRQRGEGDELRESVNALSSILDSMLAPLACLDAARDHEGHHGDHLGDEQSAALHAPVDVAWSVAGDGAVSGDVSPGGAAMGAMGGGMFEGLTGGGLLDDSADICLHCDNEEEEEEERQGSGVVVAGAVGIAVFGGAGCGGALQHGGGYDDEFEADEQERAGGGGGGAEGDGGEVPVDVVDKLEEARQKVTMLEAALGALSAGKEAPAHASINTPADASTNEPAAPQQAEAPTAVAAPAPLRATKPFSFRAPKVGQGVVGQAKAVLSSLFSSPSRTASLTTPAAPPVKEEARPAYMQDPPAPAAAVIPLAPADAGVARERSAPAFDGASNTPAQDAHMSAGGAEQEHAAASPGGSAPPPAAGGGKEDGYVATGRNVGSIYPVAARVAGQGGRGARSMLNSAGSGGGEGSSVGAAGGESYPGGRGGEGGSELSGGRAGGDSYLGARTASGSGSGSGASAGVKVEERAPGVEEVYTVQTRAPSSRGSRRMLLDSSTSSTSAAPAHPTEPYSNSAHPAAAAASPPPSAPHANTGPHGDAAASALFGPGGAAAAGSVSPDGEERGGSRGGSRGGKRRICAADIKRAMHEASPPPDTSTSSMAASSAAAAPPAHAPDSGGGKGRCDSAVSDASTLSDRGGSGGAGVAGQGRPGRRGPVRAQGPARFSAAGLGLGFAVKAGGATQGGGGSSDDEEGAGAGVASQPAGMVSAGRRAGGVGGGGVGGGGWSQMAGADIDLEGSLEMIEGM